MLEQLKATASIIKDVGFIIGIPFVITIGLRIYDFQVKAQETNIKALEAQNTVLKETQFDRAIALIEAQKKAYQVDRDDLSRQIALLKSQLEENTNFYKRDIKGIRDCSTELISRIIPIFLNNTDKPLNADELKKSISEFTSKICEF